MSLPLSLWNKTDISFIFRARAKNPGEWLSLLTTHRPLGTRNLINVYAFLFPFVNSLVKFIILFYFVVHICVCVCAPPRLQCYVRSFSRNNVTAAAVLPFVLYWPKIEMKLKIISK